MFAHLQVHMQMENHYSSAHKGASYKEVHIVTGKVPTELAIGRQAA